MPRPSMPPKKKEASTDNSDNNNNNPLSRDFTEDEIAEFKEAFAMFDLDGSGAIETHELREVLDKLGEPATDEEIQEMIELVDENGDNEIDFEEFLTLMRLRMGESGDDAEANLKAVFDIFDADKSGYIDRDEMRRLMKKLAQDLNEEEISAIMEEVDTDGDGEISFEEFKSLMIK